jgi:integrase
VLAANAPFALFIDHFLEAKGLAPKTRKDYGRYLREFDAFTGHKSLKAALTLSNASEWVEVVRPRGAYAARNSSTYLKSMASWVAKSRYLVIPGGGSLLAGLERPRTPKSQRRGFSDEQLDSIWKVLDSRPNEDKVRSIAYLRLLVGSGLRRNEARQLTVSSLHLERTRSWLHVAAHTSKGLKERDVRLDSDSAKALKAYINFKKRPKFVGKGEEPLFLTEFGKGFTEHGFGSWAGRIGKDIKKATGITWSSHRFRHQWATDYHRGMQYTGNTVYDMKREGGWADLNIVLTYAHDRPLEELLDMPTPASELRKHKSKAIA